MDDFNNLSVKVKYYKCFCEEAQGFDSIKPINIIIGKNNTGKSALLDVIEFLDFSRHNVETFIESKNKSANEFPEIILSRIYSEEELESLFPNKKFHDGYNMLNFSDIAANKEFTTLLRKHSSQSVYDFKDTKIEDIYEIYRDFVYDVTRGYITDKKNLYPILSKNCLRLSSDRDIKQEILGKEIGDMRNGDGCTQIFHMYRNRAEFDTEIITENILNDLNSIYEGEINFRDITVLLYKNGYYEINISEKDKKEIALSKSGSGIKTILLVLCYIHVLPKYLNIDLSKIVYLFEEIENNLHPSLQRNLFNYIRRIAIEKEAIFFITTHSNIVIDFFSKDETAQIVHVTHKDNLSKVKKVISYKDQKEILNDLEVRASDLLQSNCLVWVEGPSDRIYFNKWIELYTNGVLKEGYHYQCIFYGGKLLTSLTAEDPYNVSNLIKIFRINSKAIIIIDSDMKSGKDVINATKERVKSEFEKSESFVWITDGKEIENYIPLNAISRIENITSYSQIERFEIFENYLKKINATQSRKLYLKSKTAFASKIQNYLEYDDIRTVLNLDEKMKGVINTICNYNGIENTF